MGNPSELQLIFLPTGVILLGIAAFLFRSTRQFLSVSRTALGTIVGDPKAAHDYSKPRFSFTTEDGTVVVVQSYTGTKAPSFRKGQTVRVLYDPANPTRAKIDSFVQLWLATVICAGLGLSFLVVGCFIR